MAILYTHFHSLPSEPESIDSPPPKQLTDCMIAHASECAGVRNPTLVFDYTWRNADGSSAYPTMLWHIRDDSDEPGAAVTILEGLDVGYALAMRTAS